MFSLYKSSAVVVFLAVKLTLGSAVLDARNDYCGPEVQTTAIVQTITTVIEAGDDCPTPVTSIDYITREAVTTVPHACYTHTVLTPWSPTETATSSTSTHHCGPHADCIIALTTTIYIPTHDPCCRSTPTTTIASPSPTCQKGCYTDLRTVTVTPTPSYLQSQYKLVKKETAPIPFPPAETAECTTTLTRVAKLTQGPVKTVWPNVYVHTETLTGCAGCAVATDNWGGHGPVVFWKTTVTDLETSTSTSFVCEPTGDYN